MLTVVDHFVHCCGSFCTFQGGAYMLTVVDHFVHFRAGHTC